MRLELHRPVFIDETAVKTDLTRLRGRAPVGESRTLWHVGHTNIHRRTDPRCAGRAPGNPGSNERVRLRNYIETRRAPTLAPGTAVILDNLSTHNSQRAAQTLQDIGAWFLFLSPYSPDLNPIEMAFAKLKAHLRRIGARTFDTLIEALGNICHLFKPEECRNFLKAAEYASH